MGSHVKGRQFQMVVAATKQLGIGANGVMPWSLKEDMAYFKRLTSTTRDSDKRNAVIMGRRTWESIPAKFRPLPGRLNLVLSRSVGQEENLGALSNGAKQQSCRTDETGVHVTQSLSSALEWLASPVNSKGVESVFVIGGGQVYQEAIQSDLCTAIHLTSIDKEFQCDTFFPPIDANTYKLWSASEPKNQDSVPFAFLCYTRVGLEVVDLPPALAARHGEYQYLDLISDIVASGNYKNDRTGTGTLSKFGCQMRFNLRHNFPLLTTKRVFWRGELEMMTTPQSRNWRHWSTTCPSGVVEELLWFISGCTNATVLKDKGINIWEGNSSRQYLDSIGLQHREERDLGPVYGFQWRHFGAKYHTMQSDYTGEGIDQLQDVIHRIKTNPNDRRIVMTAWNPAALQDMALPPCHMFCQFYVLDGELSCCMYQRSCDLGLGVPFNIASYALLTCLIAQVCSLRPGEFVHMLGDTHVYVNHVEPLKEQLKNTPRHFPILQINPAKKSIDSFIFEDFTLVDYVPHKKIEMKMAV